MTHPVALLTAVLRGITLSSTVCRHYNCAIRLISRVYYSTVTHTRNYSTILKVLLK